MMFDRAEVVDFAVVVYTVTNSSSAPYIPVRRGG